MSGRFAGFGAMANWIAGGASAGHSGVCWLDQEEQMKDYLHVGRRRPFKKIGKDGLM
jgi:hypothetical protein